MRAFVTTLLSQTPLGNWAKLVPLAPSLYRQHIWSKGWNAYNGLYTSYEDAKKACTSDHRTGWNNTDTAQMLVGENVPKRSCAAPGTLPVFVPQTSAFAVMLWLNKTLKAGDRIVDFGGAGGISYWQYRDYFELPEGVVWTVVDMPEIIARGRASAEKAGAASLTFEFDLKAIDSCDVLISTGCLQYVPPDIFTDFCSLAKLAHTVIVNKMPLTDRADYWTVQNLMTASVPYWIPNQKSFMSRVGGAAFELRDAWNVYELTVDIPFAPAHRVPRMSGFVMQKASKS